MRLQIKLLFFIISFIILLPACNGSSDPPTATTTVTVVTTTAATTPAKTEPELPRVDLKYYIDGIEQDDGASVQAKIDEYFLEKLNCTVTVTAIPPDEWIKRVPLLFYADEQVDLIFDQSTRFYYQNVAGGVYHPLNELFARFGQDAIAQMDINTPGIIDAPKVAGELYGVPCQKQTPQSEALYFRKDIADEIGLNADTLATLQDLEPYLVKIHETRPEMTPYFVSSGTGAHMEWTTDIIKDNPYKYEELAGAVNLLLIDFDEDKVINRYETAWDLDRYETMKRWQDMGLMNADAATSTTSRDDMFGAGKTWFVSGSGAPATLSSVRNSFGTEFYRWRSTGPIVNTYQNVSALTCIPRSSADPERAMMALNLFHSDPVIVNLFNSGIEGRHYVVDADGRFKLPEGKTTKSDTGYAYGYEAFFGNMFLNNLWYGEEDDRYEELRKYNQTAKQSRILGLYVDMENVATEYAAVEAVRAQYAPILKAGVAPNVAELLKELNDKMYANGLQKIIDEAQRQYYSFTDKKR